VLYASFYAVVWALYNEHLNVLQFVGSGAMAASSVIVLVRFGLLAVVAGHLTFALLTTFPVTLDPESWLVGPSVVALAIPTVAAVVSAIFCSLTPTDALGRQASLAR